MTRLICASGVLNKGEIHARLLRVVMFDSEAFHRAAQQASALATCVSLL